MEAAAWLGLQIPTDLQSQAADFEQLISGTYNSAMESM
jgi:hypothetical protein